MKKYISVLSIAGSDSGGGAGIQADLKTMSALGCYGTTAVTAITVQNTLGVKKIHPVPVDIINDQIEAVMEDIRPMAIKIGMVNRPEVVLMLQDILKKHPTIPVIFDPVMVASSGDMLIAKETIQLLRSYLISNSTLITPNLDEAGILLDRPILNLEEMQIASREMRDQTNTNILLKGGHLDGEVLYDVLCEKNGNIHVFSSDRIDTQNTHGTGCTLSTAIGCELAKGNDLLEAIKISRAFIMSAIKAGKDVKTGEGHGPLNHFFDPLKLLKI
ncbi:MAG: bifunctional hydroxymethylpyrimidine kinase/phosphomethylpyrimidine kinase [Cyclobacteriaceae bacterium]